MHDVIDDESIYCDTGINNDLNKEPGIIDFDVRDWYCVENNFQLVGNQVESMHTVPHT